MTDGRETTRLGDRQTGGENVMEKMRERKGKKKQPCIFTPPVEDLLFS